ncbi:MAG: site-specific DNA-methyltransferase [Facklamia hominis]
MKNMRMESVDVTAQNIERIGELFPNCITETKGEDGKMKKAINFDLLRQMLSGDVLEGDEAYEFTWVGKKAAIVEANKPIRKTLRPCKEESVNWDSTENLYIEGDNLDVLKLLQESYLGKVKMIYIDPPYNTGNDFIYADDFMRSQDAENREMGMFDDDGNRLFKNTDTNGRFHSDWCSMFYSRVLLARNLLSENGVIVISIDDNEAENVQNICNEIFGESNFVANLIWKSKSGGANDSKFFAVDHEYLFVYAKKADMFVLNLDNEATVTTSYNRRDEKGEYALDRLDKQSIRYSEALDYEIIGPDGASYFPKHKDPLHPNATWRWSKDHVQSSYDELVFENGCVYTKNYKKSGAIARSLLIEERFGRTRTGKTDCFALFNRNYFSNPKPYKLIRYLCMIATSDDSIVMDFFSGSATTAHAVMQINAEYGGNRKFIMVQLPEETDEKSEAYKAGYKNICEIGKERIRRAGRKIVEENKDKERIENLDIGFRVLKLADSNMTDVYYSPAEYSQDLLSMLESNVKSDRNDLDLLFGCLLEWGLPLSLPYSSEQIDGCTVHNYNDGDLIACFDKDVPDSVIKEIANRQPLRAVLRDSSFANSPSKINVGEIFKLLAPDTRVKVI